MTGKANSEQVHQKLNQEHRQIGGYFGLMFLVFYLCTPQGGFADIPISFLLKDTLKLDPQQTAFARLLIAAPTYVAFLFGFIRDRWNPFRRGDRAIFWIFAPIAVLSFGYLATGKLDYSRLLIGAISATVAYRFLAASTQGLAADVGKRRGMTGRISTIWNIIWNLLAGVAYVLGGWVSDHLTYSQTFELLGGLTLIYIILGFWKPSAVFDGDDERKSDLMPFWPEVVRILKHRPVWPAAVIWLLWSFAPGFSTPLLYYLTNVIKASDTQYGLFFAIFAFSFIPTFLLYGYLCQRVSLKKLLWWGTVVAVPQMFPLLFLHSPNQALLLAVPIGLSGGIATAAYIDLLMRSCPKGLEGTGMMLADTGYFVALRFGDVFGSWLYKQGGFALAAWITIAVYALILPTLLFVPKLLIESHDADEATEEAMVEAAEISPHGAV
ncbi:MAG: MFS transporter [Armatimonadota bacterium]